MSDTANSQFPYTETPQDEKHAGGRPKDPNAKVLVSFRLRPDLLEYVKKWEEEAGAKGLGEAFEACLDDAKKWVARPGFARDRDAKGRWVKDNSAE